MLERIRAIRDRRNGSGCPDPATLPHQGKRPRPSKRLRPDKRTDGGFTLTELLITIIILGVLAAIVIFAVASFQQDGKLVACQTDKKNIELAVEAYYAHLNQYPADVGVLVSDSYLRELPPTLNYQLGVDPSSGTVTVIGGPTGC